VKRETKASEQVRIDSLPRTEGRVFGDGIHSQGSLVYGIREELPSRTQLISSDLFLIQIRAQVFQKLVN
jgi:hypothetical protein